MGGSSKSQKACRLTTLEAKLAKKPANYSENVVMYYLFIKSLSSPKISIVLPINFYSTDSSLKIKEEN